MRGNIYIIALINLTRSWSATRTTAWRRRRRRRRRNSCMFDSNSSLSLRSIFLFPRCVLLISALTFPSDAGVFVSCLISVWNNNIPRVPLLFKAPATTSSLPPQMNFTWPTPRLPPALISSYSSFPHLLMTVTSKLKHYKKKEKASSQLSNSSWPTFTDNLCCCEPCLYKPPGRRFKALQCKSSVDKVLLRWFPLRFAW